MENKIKTVEIVKAYDINMWVEKDFGGSNHIMIKHDAPGQHPFQYITINYNYAHTTNTSRDALTEQIMLLHFGIKREDVVWKNRSPENIEESIKQLEKTLEYYRNIK